jgi:hypothetical protein
LGEIALTQGEDQQPVGAALGSAVVGAVCGLILYRVFVALVPKAEFAVLLTAAGVAVGVAALSRYRRHLLGARTSRVWLPAALGASAGGAAGLAVVWLDPPGPWLLTFLPVGGVAGGVASFVAEILPRDAPEESSSP